MGTKHLEFSTLVLALAAAILASCAGSRVPGLPPATGAAARDLRATASTEEEVLFSFSGGTDGGNAASQVVLDGQGNLFGTTVIGGSNACGTVFKLAPQPSPPWQETVLYSFGCYADGKNPHGGVTLDAHGNLYGTTVSGGTAGCDSYGCGVAFQIDGTTESVLHDFAGGKDGFGPGGGVTLDRSGNLYGTTPDGGHDSQGVIYELSPNGNTWRERIAHAFTGGKDGGVGSLGLLLLDKSNALYGVAEEGGPHGAGTVFRLSHVSKRSWKFTTIYAFRGAPDAASPYGGLIADSRGDLFGTTYYGGVNGLGAVFELKVKGQGRYSERVLYSFHGGPDGSSPTSTLALSGSTLYGTTSAGGGSCDCGTIFSVNAKSGSERVMHAFGSSGDGAYPYYGLARASGGTFYGTTVAGGEFNQGTVFEFKP